MVNLIKQIIKESISKETQIEIIKNIPSNTINEKVAQISEMALDDVILKSIMDTYDKSDDNGKNKISSIMTGSPNKPREFLLEILRDMDYDEINQIRKEIRKELSLKENYKNLIKKLILEQVTKTKVICDICGWSWNIKDGGKDKYVCHECGHDNTPKEEENILNEKCWKGYTQKGMKTMFGKQYPNCVKK